MKKNNGKIPLILQVIIMYAVYIYFFVIALCVEDDALSDRLIIVVWILFLLCFGIGFVNIIVAILHIFFKSQSPTLITLITKISLIPWYILNFLFWFLAFAICINPWLLPFAPIILALGVVSTYFLMVCTGVHNLSYVIKLVRNKELKLTCGIVMSIIFHFVFALDIIGSFTLHYYLKPFSKKELPKNSKVIVEE